MNNSIYRPSIPRWLKLCEQNYVGLLRLLPDVDTEELQYTFSAKKNEYTIAVSECSRFTTTLVCVQNDRGLPHYLKAEMTVRLYHDLKVAEVLSWQRSKVQKAKYAYPNDKMHQPNERELSDRFLAEWISFCQQSKLIFNQ